MVNNKKERGPMKHIHHESINSTSLYLKKNINDLLVEDQHILISCRHQVKGQGRNGSHWVHLENSLAFSFNLRPCIKTTLTPLEMTLLISKYFKETSYVKWPNDLLNTDYKKMGGVLCHFLNEQQIIIGTGVNIGKIKANTHNFPYPEGALDKTRVLTEKEYETLPSKIYRFILDNRMSPSEITKEWVELCAHKHKNIKIIDGKNECEGVFQGINEDGAAMILDSQNKLVKVMNGSLFIL